MLTIVMEQMRCPFSSEIFSRWLETGSVWCMPIFQRYETNHILLLNMLIIQRLSYLNPMLTKGLMRHLPMKC